MSKNILKQINSLRIDKNSRVYVYGTGSMAINTKNNVDSENIKIAGFIDSYRDGILDGINIIKIDEYVKDQKPCDVIIMGSSFDQEIIHNLDAKNYILNLYTLNSFLPPVVLWNNKNPTESKNKKYFSDISEIGWSFINENEMYRSKNDQDLYIANLVRYCQEINPGAWIFVSHHAAGDNALFLMLLRAFREIYRPISDKILILCTKNQKELLKLWEDDIDTAVAVDRQHLDFMFNTFKHGLFMPGVPLVGAYFFNNICTLTYGLTTLAANKISMRLPSSSTFVPPTIQPQWKEEAKAILEEHGYLPNKTVFLFPESFTVPPPPKSFWLEIAETFQKQGFKIIWNSGSEWVDMCPNSISLKLPFTQIIPAIELAGHAVFSRSGGAELCCGTWCQAKKSLVEYKFPLWENSIAIMKNTAVPAIATLGYPTSAQLHLVGNEYQETIHDIIAYHTDPT